MIAAIAGFFVADIFSSIALRRYLVKRSFSWPGAITSYLYNTVAGVLYLDLIVNRNFLIVMDAEEVYISLWPTLFVLSGLMIPFHAWAFSGGTLR